jgi:hypothetical protein
MPTAARISLFGSLREGQAMNQSKTSSTSTRGSEKTNATPRRRLIAVGKRVDGRWQVRTSLWRYLASTALSSQ